MDAELYQLLQLFIVKNNIQLHKEELKLQLLSHPSYPSLHSITGVLDHFGVPNAALMVPSNSEVLEQAPNSFLANISLDIGEKLVLAEKKSSSVKITYQDKKTESHSNENFLKLWTGVVVAIEKDDTVIETTQTKASIGKWILYPITLALLGFGLYANSDLFASAHLILSVFGFILSIFIVKHELGSQSAATNSFCNLSENTSCDAILNSKGATIIGSFKLSDLAIIAFAACCLCWIGFALTGVTNFTTMSILTLLAFPFTIYSLYYQFSVVKKWCPLCLGIVLVLLLQTIALVSFDFPSIGLDTSLSELSIVGLSFFISAGTWSFIKPLLKKQKTLDALEVDHYKFKRKFSLFNALYKEKTPLQSIEIAGEIVFGNEYAPIELVLVTSPLCHFCKSAHKDLEKILLQAKDKVKVTVRFMVDPENKTGILYKIVSQLLHIYHNEGKASCLNNLNVLYAENATSEAWLATQQLRFNSVSDAVMRQQKDWCEENLVNFTPALFVNNRAFPSEYGKSDLLYFIDDLIDQMETNTPSIKNLQPLAS